MMVLQDYLSQISYVGLQVLPINCCAWRFQSCSKRGFGKPDYNLLPWSARPWSAGIPADFSEAMLQGDIRDEQGVRNLSPGIHAGHSYTPLDDSSRWDYVLCSHVWVYPWDWFCCLRSWEKQGELLFLEIWELHLRGQRLASCLSSLLTCIGL